MWHEWNRNAYSGGVRKSEQASLKIISIDGKIK
jgi:hypothetical protein